MSNIFIGFLFIFFNLDLTLNQGTIGLFPDFVGYILLVKGVVEMASESTLFMKVRSLCIGMGIYTGILYAFDLFGFKPQLGWIGILLGVVSTIVSLYISYVIVRGVQNMEDIRAIDLNGNKLRSTWNYLAVFQCAVYLFLILPFLAAILLVISAIVSVIFLIEFNASKTLYNEIE